MEEYFSKSFSMSLRWLQMKLLEENGDDVFATMRKRPTVACFRGSGLKLINTWYTERAVNKKDERMRIVETAAAIIREDIKTTAYSRTDYPDLKNFTDGAENLVPEILRVLLMTIIMKNKKGRTKGIDNKRTAIAHSVISATRPRSFISPSNHVRHGRKNYRMP